MLWVGRSPDSRDPVVDARHGEGRLVLQGHGDQLGVGVGRLPAGALGLNKGGKQDWLPQLITYTLGT